MLKQELTTKDYPEDIQKFINNNFINQRRQHLNNFRYLPNMFKTYQTITHTQIIC